MDDDAPVKRKQREPITMVFAAILLAAIIIAVGIHINDNILNKSVTTADDKSTVVVDYTGSFYNYYDQTGAALFQTSVKSIEDNTAYVHASSYSQGSQLTIDMSKSDYLADFQNALLGHKAGDTVRVAIPADKGYAQPDILGIIPCSVPLAIYSEESTYELYDNLGWKYSSVEDKSKGLYCITPLMSNSDVCTSTSTTFGTVKTSGFTQLENALTFKLEVTGLIPVKKIDGTDMTYTYQGVEFKAVEMFQLPCAYGNQVTVIGVNDVSNPTQFLYKNCDERYNQDLYFEITIKSITKS